MAALDDRGKFMELLDTLGITYKQDIKADTVRVEVPQGERLKQETKKIKGRVLLVFQFTRPGAFVRLIVKE